MPRKENIGAAGITRPSCIDFPALLIVLRKNWPTKLDWGTTVADIIDGVLLLMMRPGSLDRYRTMIRTTRLLKASVKQDMRR